MFDAIPPHGVFQRPSGTLAVFAGSRIGANPIDNEFVRIGCRTENAVISCPGWDSNPHTQRVADFKSAASASFATRAAPEATGIASA